MLKNSKKKKRNKQKYIMTKKSRLKEVTKSQEVKKTFTPLRQESKRK
jgi:glycerol-3-phosphate cytidylyltransferase-like family protein